MIIIHSITNKRRTSTRAVLGEFDVEALMQAIEHMPFDRPVKLAEAIEWCCLRCGFIQITHEKQEKCSVCKKQGRENKTTSKYYSGDLERLMIEKLKQAGLKDK